MLRRLSKAIVSDPKVFGLVKEDMNTSSKRDEIGMLKGQASVIINISKEPHLMEVDGSKVIIQLMGSGDAGLLTKVEKKGISLQSISWR